MKIENFVGRMDEGWLNKLSPFLTSNEFDNIIEALRKEKELEFVVCPEVQYLFRAFQVCKYNDLKAIIIGQDPYYQVGVADGIAMSCSLTGELQPSLRLFYDEISRTVYGGGVSTKDYPPSLDYLAKQGVLLINVALTVREKEPRSHLEIWKPFMEYLFLEVINSYQRGLPIVILGAEAAKIVEPMIAPFTHYPLTTEHPAYASRLERPWNSNGVFLTVNNILRVNNGKEFEIVWMNNYGAEESTES